MFFAEREAAKIPDLPADTPVRPVAVVAAIGAGTMGSGIAIACLNAGLEIRLMDREQAFVDKGLASIEQTFASAVARGRLSEAQKAERLAKVRGVTRYQQIADVDLVIEAVFEEMSSKKEVFGALDRVCKPGAILATNTSTLDVNEIAASTKRPQDVIGLHSFSPANITRLLEIVRGAKTANDVIATSMKLARTLRGSTSAGACASARASRQASATPARFPTTCANKATSARRPAEASTSTNPAVACRARTRGSTNWFGR